LLKTDPGLRTPDPGPIFGLTGGIACGKSTVARFFQDLGAYVIDADRLGHEVIEPGQAAHQEIVERFGQDILDSGGRIDRKKLGPRVFANPPLLAALNAIVHPRVMERTRELAAEEHQRKPRGVVILDAPLIFEAGLETRMLKVVVVWCRPEQQMERLIAKTGFSREEAERRIQAQVPADEKRRRADYVIDCSGTLEESLAQVQTLYPQLLELVQQPN